MQFTIPNNPYMLIPPSLLREVHTGNQVAIVVGHSDKIAHAFLETLSQTGMPILYTDKRYSGNNIFRQKIQQLTAGQVISSVDDCLAYIQRHPTRDYLIFDTSGLVSERVQEMQGNFFIVEDTANGLFWTEQKPLRYPIFSIAYSKVKQDIENPAVAHSLFSAMMANSHLARLPIHNEPVLLVGFGSIGSRLAVRLQSVTNRLTVYDHQVQKVLQSRSYGFQSVNQLDETIHQYKWIVSTAGAPRTIGLHYLEQLRDGCCLVNCSTRRWEFDADFFAKYQATTTLDEHEIETVDLGDRCVHRLNRGYPVNFWRNGGTQDHLALYTTFAFWLESGLRILCERKQPRPAVHEVDSVFPDLHRKYHQFYADALAERAALPPVPSFPERNGAQNALLERAVLA